MNEETRQALFTELKRDLDEKLESFVGVPATATNMGKVRVLLEQALDDVKRAGLLSETSRFRLVADVEFDKHTRVMTAQLNSVCKSCGWSTAGDAPHPLECEP